MNFDSTLVSYFIQASLVVKIVMIILIGASIFSWAYILQRTFYLSRAKRFARRFESAFDAEEDLSRLYSAGTRTAAELQGLEAIFHAGFKEFLRLRRHAHFALDTIIDNCKRAMRIKEMQEQDRLEAHLSFLAIVGTTSPYVGLFGTVWGIMQAFRALANVEQASIAMVAPGIAEALIATALGLFAAIPAVIAYNRFITEISRLLNRYDAFEESLTNALIRQHQNNSAEVEQKDAVWSELS